MSAQKEVLQTAITGDKFFEEANPQNKLAIISWRAHEVARELCFATSPENFAEQLQLLQTANDKLMEVAQGFVDAVKSGQLFYEGSPGNIRTYRERTG